MAGVVMTRDLVFDTVRQSRAVYVTVDTNPQAIVKSLGLYPLPKGIVSISGGATEFPPTAVDKTVALIEKAILPLVYEYDLLVVDGGTEAGVMKITGEVFRAKYPDPIIIGGGSRPKKNKFASCCSLPLLGFAPEPKVNYPGVERSLNRNSELDPNHFYFVLVCDAEDWGEEVESMFSFLDYLAVRRQVPIVNVVANGGRITIKEAFHAVEGGWQVVVLEGSYRATEVIVAALNGASREDLLVLLSRCEIKVEEYEVGETLYWLESIAQYDKVTRFNFTAGSPDELRKVILSGLGLNVRS